MFLASLLKQPKCKSVQMSLLLLKKMDCHCHNSFLLFCRMLRGLSPVLEAISPVTSTLWKASFIELVAITKRFLFEFFYSSLYIRSFEISNLKYRQQIFKVKQYHIIRMIFFATNDLLCHPLRGRNRKCQNAT